MADICGRIVLIKDSYLETDMSSLASQCEMNATFTFIVHETVEEAVVREDGEQGNICKAVELVRLEENFHVSMCTAENKVKYCTKELVSAAMYWCDIIADKRGEGIVTL
nr:hypothetical protein [Tanacetum cinerariifolium]GEX23073.1 hypothetical protein [Tanacetum cinerariifolium]